MHKNEVPKTFPNKDTSSETMLEKCLVVDATDMVIGSLPKLDCHYRKKVRHRAFSVLLFDFDGRLLVQRRSAEKITFPKVWANSCCSHPLDIAGENSDPISGVIAAARRKLNQELGIAAEITNDWEFHHVGKIEYSCQWDENWGEWEIDHILIVQAEVDVTLNTDEVSEVCWLTPSNLKSMMEGEGKWVGEIIAPWFRLIWQHFIVPREGNVVCSMPHANEAKIVSCGEVTLK
uniref:Isopentenyl-diphosphate delta-isomerase n=1 Tax=Candidatus Kentrum sp. LPFa TaxID=2126335 RepID=A0A450X454_9GAMM|nr:MAG: isopentenyl-diphosphate delta-isomerase [Candidatus Kentron sp. LPFa]VFK35741.1 MAG: isopentenyl-diphosphate delta-isomerase [Candidatus Kentron sp. LPFa]